MKKKVVFISFAQVRKPYYPKKPRKGIYQWILDVRFLYEPYRHGYQESGLEKSIYKLITKENKRFFLTMGRSLEESVGLFLASEEYHTFQIFSGCYGGWQRSVASAEYFKNRIKRKWPELSVIAKHLAIENL